MYFREDITDEAMEAESKGWSWMYALASFALSKLYPLGIWYFIGEQGYLSGMGKTAFNCKVSYKIRTKSSFLMRHKSRLDDEREGNVRNLKSFCKDKTLLLVAQVSMCAWPINISHEQGNIVEKKY